MYKGRERAKGAKRRHEERGGRGEDEKKKR